jgi:glycosyltransferase involved in cell wall biosynthesis
MRIAIACSGLGHVQRGYEAFSTSLFNALQGKVDVTLFRGSGPSGPGQVVIPCLNRRMLAGRVDVERAYRIEQLTFSAALLPRLWAGRFDLLHYSDYLVGRALQRAWGIGGLPLLFSNALPLEPHRFAPGIYIHQVAQSYYDLACKEGIARDRMRLAPYAINPEEFANPLDQASARKKYGIPESATVVLAVSALDFGHKRLDYLIKEVASLNNSSYYLCIAGEPSGNTAQIKDMAASLLGGRHKILTLPRAEMPSLYSAADIFVHSAIEEGFGLVLLEAMAAGLPVMAHDSRHFRWLMSDAGVLVDMTAPRALSSAIERVSGDKAERNRLQAKSIARAHCFSWRSLIPGYIAMYQSVIEASKQRPVLGRTA